MHPKSDAVVHGMESLGGPMATNSESTKPFGPESIERIYRQKVRPGTFRRVEDVRQPLGPAVVWRRRRVVWLNDATGDAQGLCINELRVGRLAQARIEPLAAQAAPDVPWRFDDVEHAYWQTCWAGGALRQDRGVKASRLFLNLSQLYSAAPGQGPSPLWEDLESIQRRVTGAAASSGPSPEELAAVEAFGPVARPQDGSPWAAARFLPAFRPSVTLEQDSDIIAMTNGGYFLNFPEEYDDGVSALHEPVGAMVASERLLMPPWIERPAAVECRDGARSIELLGPENLSLRMADGLGVSLVRGIREPQAEATVWRAFDGPLPAAPDHCVDLVFAGAQLLRLARPGLHQPPHGGAIVRLHGAAAEPWLARINSPLPAALPPFELLLVTTSASPVRWAMAAGPRLLSGGRTIPAGALLESDAAGEFRAGGPPPTRFPYDADRTRAPRTAIGLGPDGEWIMTVVDGRADPAHSVGATLEELSSIMWELGAMHALNLDGGGSSIMAIAGLKPAEQVRPGLAPGIANLPSDPGHRERIVPAALVIRR